MTTDSIPPAPPDLPIAVLLAELNRNEPYNMEEFHAAFRELKKRYPENPALIDIPDGVAVFARRMGWLKMKSKTDSRHWIMRVPPRVVKRASLFPQAMPPPGPPPPLERK